MVSKLITQTAVWIAAMAGVLFVAAGTVRWPAAWVFLAEMAGLGLAIGLWLARRDPALLAERLTTGFQAARKTWDKVFMATVFVLWTSWLVLIAAPVVKIARERGHRVVSTHFGPRRRPHPLFRRGSPLRLVLANSQLPFARRAQGKQAEMCGGHGRFLAAAPGCD
jgi:hypothetical protein